MKILEEIRNDISGLAALHDWLGDQGEPVHIMVSEFRAKICTTGNDGQPCPRNCEPNWWDRVKSKIAIWIQAELEIKNRMKVSVSREDQLHMCGACGCCLKLKVHTPILYIKPHLSQQQIDKTPAYCWMRREIQNL